MALFLAFLVGPFAPVISFPQSAFAATVGETVSFDAPGSTTWTVPAGVTSVKVSVWAGGGAGGSASSGFAGQGGGAGGYALDTISVTEGTNYSITVGAGGSVAGSSRDGGSSSFDSAVSALGGKGGASGAETLASIGYADTQCSFEGTWIYHDQGGPSSSGGANDFGVTCRSGKLTGFCNTSGTAAGMGRGLHAFNYVCEMGVTPDIGTKCDFDGTNVYNDDGGGNDFAITCRTGKVTGYCGTTSLPRGINPGNYACEYGQPVTASAPRCNFNGSWSYNDEDGGNDFAMTCRNGYMVGWCGATPLQRGGPQIGNYVCAPAADSSSGTPSAFDGAGGTGTAGSDLQTGGSASAVTGSTPTAGGSAVLGGAGEGGAGASSGDGSDGANGRVTIEVVSVVSGPVDFAPGGFIDGADCNQFNGWAYDPNASSTQIMVHLYADGPAGSGTFVGATLASIPRPDVNTVAQIPGDHGFSFATPNSLKDGVSHEIWAYGINTDPSGQNGLLPKSGPVAVDSISMGSCTFVPPVDNAPADPTVAGPVTGTVDAPYSFAVTATDPENGQIRYGFDWDNDGTIDEHSAFVASGTTANISHTWAVAGTYTFKVYAIDQTASNQSGAVSHTIVISPAVVSGISSVSISVSPNPVAIAYGGSVQLSVDSTAAVTGFATLTNHGIEVRVNGGAWSNAGAWPTPAANTARTSDASFTALNLSSAGAYEFRTYASIDNGGSYTYSSPVAVTVTVDAPPAPTLDSVSITASPASVVIPIGGSEQITVISTASVTGGAPLTNHGIEVRVDGGAWSNAGAWPTPAANTARTSDASFTALNLSSAGAYEFRTYASIDGGSNYIYSSVASVSATMSVNHAPVISGVAGPATGLVNTSYVFTATATDQDGDTIEYGFDWNNSGTIDGSEAWTPAVSSGTPVGRSNIWTVNGTHSFQVLARDSNGASVSFPVSISISGGASNIGFTVATSSSGFFTSENGGTAIFTVILNSAPLSSVTFPVSSSDWTEGTTSVSSLVFSPSDWNVSQTVTITGVDDSTLDGDVAYSVSIGPSTSSDVNYNNLSAQTIPVSNYDNEVAPSSSGTSGGSSSGGGGGGGYSGPCIGNCPSAVVDDTVASSGDVLIIIDAPVVASAPAIPNPPKFCTYDDFMTTYLRRGIENDPNEVKKLQYFLNTYENAALSMTGTFDEATENAVKAFQGKYPNEILAPWGTDTPTGIVYITTAAAINRMFCGDNPSYRGNDDIKDIINPVLYTPIDNSNQFEGVIGAAETSTSTSIAAVFGAISGDIGKFLKGIPWYELILILLLLFGSGLIVNGMLQKDILSPTNVASFAQGITALAVGSVLNVFNTLSFMMRPEWFAEKIGMDSSWVLGLDAVNLLAVVAICLSLLAVIYRKLLVSGVK